VEAAQGFLAGFGTALVGNTAGLAAGATAIGIGIAVGAAPATAVGVVLGGSVFGVLANQVHQRHTWFCDAHPGQQPTFEQWVSIVSLALVDTLSLEAVSAVEGWRRRRLLGGPLEPYQAWHEIGGLVGNILTATMIASVLRKLGQDSAAGLIGLLRKDRPSPANAADTGSQAGGATLAAQAGPARSSPAGSVPPPRMPARAGWPALRLVDDPPPSGPQPTSAGHHGWPGTLGAAVRQPEAGLPAHEQPVPFLRLVTRQPDRPAEPVGRTRPEVTRARTDPPPMRSDDKHAMFRSLCRQTLEPLPKGSHRGYQLKAGWHQADATTFQFEVTAHHADGKRPDLRVAISYCLGPETIEMWTRTWSGHLPAGREPTRPWTDESLVVRRMVGLAWAEIRTVFQLSRNPRQPLIRLPQSVLITFNRVSPKQFQNRVVNIWLAAQREGQPISEHDATVRALLELPEFSQLVEWAGKLGHQARPVVTQLDVFTESYLPPIEVELIATSGPR